MSDLIKIGLITKPQGVRGEIKVNPITDDLSRFKNLKYVIVDGVEIKVLGSKISNDAVILSLFGIADRNTAETFRGKFLHVKREDAVSLSNNRFFIDDIMGSTVLFENGKTVGKITDITKAKTDYFTLLSIDGKVVRFPFLKTLLVQFNLAEKTLIINEKRFMEVACYED